MSESIKNLDPKAVWANFYSLTQIPRPSKHEEQVSKFVADFGRKLGLETIVDEVGNVIIRKPATPGYEDRQGVVLQGHLDMVPQKTPETQHDFLKDPIDAYVDGEYVKARGTTLGGDNGMGAAMAMTVLADKELKHGPIEALFTVDEETGMTGANALKPGVLKGAILLNLDTETNGELYVGCAGGLDANLNIPINHEALPADRTPLKLEVANLKGGHSGVDIVLGRGNAIKLLLRWINHLDKFDVRLMDFEGGNLRNTIPREAYAIIAVPKSQLAEVGKALEQEAARMKAELEGTEPGLRLTQGAVACPNAKMFTKESHQRVVRGFLVCPNGVIRMSDAVPGLVETSSNMAAIKVVGTHVEVLCLMRSSVETAKEALAEQMQAAVELAGGSAAFSGGYQGWKPNVHSAILQVMKDVYKQLHGVEPAVVAIHAGLECGIIGGKYPQMDMISFGPTVLYPHSPDERVEIVTVQDTWNFLVHTLENIPAATGTAAHIA